MFAPNKGLDSLSAAAVFFSLSAITITEYYLLLLP
jgi:hypothetical protein